MNWPLVKLGDVAPAKPAKHAFSDNDEIWTLNLDQIEADTGNLLGKVMAPISEAGTSTHGFDAHHVLYSKLRPYLNKVVLPDEKGLATTELVPMLPDPLRLDRKYLAYYLRSKSFVDWVSSQVAGAKMPRVSMQLFWQHEIPLPPLAEQKRIAAILDKADTIRRKRQQAIQLADDFLRAVFLDMFGDPVTNPKGWEVSSLSDLIHLQGGFAFKSGDFSDSGIPVVKIGNANKAGFTTKEIAYIAPERPEKLVQYELYPGDLLMSLTGTVGKDDYANVTEVTSDYEKYYLNQRVAKISITSESITKTYLKHLLAHPKIKNEITKNNRGVRQANISNGDIYELIVPVPDSELLSKFNRIVSKSNALIKNLNQYPKLDGSLFSSLSQKAFRGEL